MTARLRRLVAWAILPFKLVGAVLSALHETAWVYCFVRQYGPDRAAQYSSGFDFYTALPVAIRNWEDEARILFPRRYGLFLQRCHENGAAVAPDEIEVMVQLASLLVNRCLLWDIKPVVRTQAPAAVRKQMNALSADYRRICLFAPVHAFAEVLFDRHQRRRTQLPRQ